MIDAMAVQVRQTAHHLTRQLEAICRSKEPALNHFADIEPIKKFEYEERWAITRQKVSVDDLHHVLVRWQIA
jgi:hypothetical protein